MSSLATPTAYNKRTRSPSPPRQSYSSIYPSLSRTTPLSTGYYPNLSSSPASGASFSTHDSLNLSHQGSTATTANGSYFQTPSQQNIYSSPSPVNHNSASPFAAYANRNINNGVANNISNNNNAVVPINTSLVTSSSSASSTSSSLSLSSMNSSLHSSDDKLYGNYSLQKLNNAATEFAKEFDHDERSNYAYDTMHSGQSGQYYYDRQPLQFIKCLPTPPHIIQAYDELECKAYTGLLTDIHRAYVTIDNKLYLWNYLDGSDFFVYDELTQIIVSVALVKPKPDIFVESIRYLLVIATPVEVLVFAVKFEGDDIANSLSLYPTQFTVPSDNIQMRKIIGTSNGRIFMCGIDGHVYELDYQAHDTWFSKKCRKLNHSSNKFAAIRAVLPLFFSNQKDTIDDVVYDAGRNLLFTLSSRSEISLYDLGSDGLQMTLRQTLGKIHESCRRLLQSVNSQAMHDWAKPEQFSIVSIQAVSKHEARNVCLVGITNHAHRIFFSINPNDKTLQARFIRLCPPACFDADRSQTQSQSLTSSTTQPLSAEREAGFKAGKSPSNVHAAYYKNRVFLVAEGGHLSTASSSSSSSVSSSLSSSLSSATSSSSSQPLGDILVSVHSSMPNPTPFNSTIQFKEYVHSKSLESKIADIAEISLDIPPYSLFSSTRLSAALTNHLDRLASLPELATQHFLPTRLFLVLTSTGIYTYIKRKPVDELREILHRRKRTSDDSELIKFAASYGSKEISAMFIMLATAAPQMTAGSIASPGPENNSNGVIHSPSSVFASPRPIDDHMRKLARSAYFVYGGTDKLAGLTLYFSRWMILYWDHTVLSYKDSSKKNNKQMLRDNIILTFNSDFYLEIRNNLIRLQNFLRANVKYFVRDFAESNSSASQNMFHNLGNVTNAGSTGPSLHEIKFESLCTFLDLSVEVFSLLLLFTSHPHVSDILTSSCFTQGQLDLLCETKFSDLLTKEDGKNIFKNIISSLISYTRVFSSNQNIASAVHTPDESTLLAKFHSECPTFFASSDLAHFHALEHLNKAALKYTNKKEREFHLNKALDFYDKTLKSTNFPLVEVSSVFAKVHFYTGIVDLCLRRAQFLQQGEVVLPRQSTQAVAGAINHSLNPFTEADYIQQERNKCYDCILDAIHSLIFGASDSSNSSSTQSLAVSATSTTSSHSSNSPVLLLSVTPPALSADEKSLIRRQVLDLCLSSVDSTFHERLYHFHIERDLLSDLLKIKSPYLVPYLRKQAQVSYDQDDTASATSVSSKIIEKQKYVNILKDYFLAHNMYEDAADLLNQLSYSQGKQYTLWDRTGFLANALTCALNVPAYHGQEQGNSSQLNNSQIIFSQEGDLIYKLRGRIEVGRIQMEIYTRIKSILDGQYSNSQLHSIEEAYASNIAQKERELHRFHTERQRYESVLDQLDQELLVIEVLYEICSEHGLWDIGLSIYHIAEEKNRPDVIHGLWRNIFRVEIVNADQSGVDWRDNLVIKFKDLALRLKEADWVFPLEFIIQELEHNHAKYHRARFDPEKYKDFVAKLLIEAKINTMQLLAVYERLIASSISATVSASSFAAAGANRQLQLNLYRSVYYILNQMLIEQNQNLARGIRAVLPYNVANTLLHNCIANLKALASWIHRQPSSASLDQSSANTLSTLSREATVLTKSFEELHQQFNQPR